MSDNITEESEAAMFFGSVCRSRIGFSYSVDIGMVTVGGKQ